jgi:hypothetical protein
MLKLFGSLPGMVKREADPFADARSAAAWMKELRHGHDITGQLQGVRDLVSTLESRKVFVLDTLKALFVIDEQIQPTFEQVRQQYIQNPRAGKAIEERLWDTSVGMSRTMLAAYHPFVRMEDPKPEEEAGFHQATALLLARALRYR